MYPPPIVSPWRDNRRFVRSACAGWLVSIAVAGVAAAVRSGDAVRAARAGNVRPYSFGTGYGHGANLFTLVSLAGTVLVIVATWRLAKAHAQLGRPASRWGPAWAVAGRLIPLASAVLPALQLGELWRGSHPATRHDDPSWRENPTSAPVRAVLIGGLVSATIGVIAMIRIFGAMFDSAMFDSLRDARNSRTFDDAVADAIAAARPWVIAGAIASFITAVLASSVLVRIADRQQLLREADPTPSAAGYPLAHPWQATFPPGWFADPWGRYPLRWWDGTTWTTHTSVDGHTAEDPIPEQPPHIG